MVPHISDRYSVKAKATHTAPLQHFVSAAVSRLMERPQRPTGAANLRRLEQARSLAKLMDSNFRIPVLGIRFGWDGLLGLIPGVGDLISAAVGAWIVATAYRAGVPNGALLLMAGNIAVDVGLGTLPVVGDLFDVYWKSNLRNVQLLEQHLNRTSLADPSLSNQRMLT